MPVYGYSVSISEFNLLEKGKGQESHVKVRKRVRKKTREEEREEKERGQEYVSAGEKVKI